MHMSNMSEFKTNPRRLIAAVALVACLVGSASACSSGSKSDAGKAKTTTTAKSGKGSGKADVSGVYSPADLPQEPTLTKAVGIRDDATMSSCDTAPGTVTAVGTVTNTSKAAADILVTVSWTTAMNDVVARAYAVSKAVPPNQKVTWKASGKLAKGNKDVECVINVRRGTLK